MVHFINMFNILKYEEIFVTSTVYKLKSVVCDDVNDHIMLSRTRPNYFTKSLIPFNIIQTLVFNYFIEEHPFLYTKL